MTRNEAAAKVNEAFKAAKVGAAVADPKAKGFSGEVEGHVFKYEFKHGAHAHEMRKTEVAHFRLALVAELLAKFAQSHLQPKPEPAPVADPKAKA